MTFDCFIHSAILKGGVNLQEDFTSDQRNEDYYSLSFWKDHLTVLVTNYESRQLYQQGMSVSSEIVADS